MKRMSAREFGWHCDDCGNDIDHNLFHYVEHADRKPPKTSLAESINSLVPCHAIDPPTSVPLVAVPANTTVTCISCGSEYDILNTRAKGNAGGRICCDCIDGLKAEDMPAGLGGKP